MSKNSKTVAKHRKAQKGRGFKRKEIEVTIEDGLLTPRLLNGEFGTIKKEKFFKALAESVEHYFNPNEAGYVYRELYTYYNKYLRKSLMTLFRKE